MSEFGVVPGLPTRLCASGEKADWVFDEASEMLTVTAGPDTDMFVDPADGAATLTAPRLTGAVEGDFQLSARVRVGFGSVYDAGVLSLQADDRHWAKLCFEYSPQRTPMVVSVVTRGVSDDANGFVVEGDEVLLRISRLGAAYAFHASVDGGRFWQLIRYFDLDTTRPVEVGFEAQSPTGPGCTVTFSQISFLPNRLADLRDGS
ncbi:MAG: hypothetical protein JWN00_3888 [Actinomycetia bacterium]|nr:hypothetical protein [Actinomycetes bacterium]